MFVCNIFTVGAHFFIHVKNIKIYTSYIYSYIFISANGATIIDNLFLLDTTVDVLTGKFNKSHRSNTAKLMLL